MTLRRQDSAIRFSESVKSLRERFDFSVKESAMFRTLWEGEKNARAEDKKNHQHIIDGYAAIEAGQRIRIAALTKKINGQRRANRFLIVISLGAAGFGVYQALK